MQLRGLEALGMSARGEEEPGVCGLVWTFGSARCYQLEGSLCSGSPASLTYFDAEVFD